MIAFVRHGETEPNRDGLLLGRSDVSLTGRGREQADRLAKTFTDRGVARVLTSPLRRARETAEPIASACGVTPEVDDRLIEVDYGEWEATPFAGLEPEIVRRWRRDADFAPPGGESLAAVAARTGSLCDELLGTRADDVLVAVSHVSPIKAAVTWTLGVSPELAWRMRLDVASITRIGRGPVLLSFNESP
jgi:broad specificity phosphatase PhoE